MTFSKSCSDKLALAQCTSLLSSLTSVLVSPSNAYLNSLVLPGSQLNQIACGRAFGIQGRMKNVVEEIWSGGYVFNAFQIETTDREFSHSRRSMASSFDVAKGSNISAIFNPRLQETLINGVLQGWKQSDPRGKCALCNVRMWNVFLDAATALALPILQGMRCVQKYSDLKESELFEQLNEVKRVVRGEALQGWIRNDGDDFELLYE